MEADDRVRLTARNASSWGLSVRRHTDRWEQTPFTGTLEELREVSGTLMRHMSQKYMVLVVNSPYALSNVLRTRRDHASWTLAAAA